jgi:hypothetical protein
MPASRPQSQVARPNLTSIVVSTNGLRRPSKFRDNQKDERSVNLRGLRRALVQVG